MGPLLVYPKHLRMAGYCMSGSRHWFKHHGFDWGEFVRDGIPAEALLDTGDALAVNVVEQAKKEQRNGKK